MATLDRLALSTTADPALVTGAGAAGNDQQLKTLLTTVRNRHKRSPWANQMIVTKLDTIDTVATANSPRIVSGYAEQGMWMRSVFIHLHKCKSTDESDSNVLSVFMYKTTATLHGAIGGSVVVDGYTGYTDALRLDIVEDLNPNIHAFIVPGVNVRIISGLDDGKHVPLPIETDYVEAGEYWNLLLVPPATSSMGVHDLDVLIQYSTLHR